MMRCCDRIQTFPRSPVTQRGIARGPCAVLQIAFANGDPDHFARDGALFADPHHHGAFPRRFGTQAMVDRGNRNGIATNGMGKRKQRHAVGAARYRKTQAACRVQAVEFGPEAR